MIDTQKLREALELIEYELQASYNNAKPVCCGHGYGECCGNPEPVWDAADQKIMDVLGPVQRALSDAVSQADAQAAEVARLREALTAIERRNEPMVESHGEAVPMGVVYGSNGVRDYFRGVARAALSGDQS